MTKITSIMLQPCIKPHCDSGRTVSATCIKRHQRIMRARTLPATDNSDMPQLEIMAFLPLCHFTPG